MMIIGICSFLLLVWLLSALDNWAEKRNVAEIERIHSDAYRLIDDYFEDEDDRLQQKTEFDIFVHDWFKQLDRDYRPQNIQEASTHASRERYKKKMAAAAKERDTIYVRRTGRAYDEAVAKNFNMTLEEWYETVERFKKNQGILQQTGRTAPGHDDADWQANEDLTMMILADEEDEFDEYEDDEF